MRDWIRALRLEADSAEIAPLSLPATVAAARTVIGDQAIAWAAHRSAQVCDELERIMRADASAALNGVERQASEAVLLVMLVALHEGPDRAAMPVEMIESGRLAARRGVKLDTVLRIIWLSHAAVQSALLEVLGHEVPPDDFAEEARELSDRMSGFVDFLIREFAEIYEQERAAWRNRRFSQQRDIVDHIVEYGRVPDRDGAVLGLPLEGHHLTAVVISVDPTPQHEKEARAQSYAGAVRRRTGAAADIVLDRGDGSMEVHWAFSPAPERLVGTIRREVPPPARTAIALGPVARGVAGMRTSVLGARQAALVAHQYEREGIWAYDDVGRFALALADPTAASEFVRTTLRGLNGPDAKSKTLRETLLIYLRHGRSRLAAAQELHIAPNTVAYRVHRAEELLADYNPDSVRPALDLAYEFPALLHAEGPGVL